jgi:hypothetical protein
MSSLSIENIIKIIAGIWAYIALLATPDKVIIASIFIVLTATFCFCVWAFYNVKQQVMKETELRTLFLKRYLQTEARTDLLTTIHNERHPEDSPKFLELERKLWSERYKELEPVCGSCAAPDKRD